VGGGNTPIPLPLPRGWHTIFICRTEGAFLISAKVVAGKVELIEISSEVGGRCYLVAPFGKADQILELNPGEKIVLTR
jgi:hypothetical protein